MNVSMAKKKAIVSLYRAGVSIDVLVAATGIERRTIKGIINWSEGRGRNAVLVEFPEIKLRSRSNG